ncbi:MAG: rRNA ((1408)-N(1))-methyltransferase [Solirubrobacteraceae bacterium]|nr:rRNA ((1408)-N(1))-methyltransferase [Solirubrobacteraceae bacterium]
MTWSTNHSLEVVIGADTEHVPAEHFAARLARYPQIVVDLGTGDGRYVLRTARARSDALVIGIDPVASAMAAAAGRARRKPARGGADNAVFLVASLEQLPGALRGAASEVTVNFPWGSLLLAVGWPRVPELRTVVELARPGAPVRALLNASAAEQEQHASRLELPPLEDEGHVAERLVPGWEEAGLTDVAWSYLQPGEDAPRRTTWGQRLIRGSGRRTLRVDALRSLTGA